MVNPVITILSCCAIEGVVIAKVKSSLKKYGGSIASFPESFNVLLNVTSVGCFFCYFRIYALSRDSVFSGHPCFFLKVLV